MSPRPTDRSHINIKESPSAGRYMLNQDTDRSHLVANTSRSNQYTPFNEKSNANSNIKIVSKEKESLIKKVPVMSSLKHNRSTEKPERPSSGKVGQISKVYGEPMQRPNRETAKK